jgi:hypothetical protein
MVSNTIFTAQDSRYNRRIKTYPLKHTGSYRTYPWFLTELNTAQDSRYNRHIKTFPLKHTGLYRTYPWFLTQFNTVLAGFTL